MKQFLVFLLVFSVFLGGFANISEAQAKGNACISIRSKQVKELQKIDKLNVKIAKLKDNQSGLKAKMTKELRKLEKSVKSKISKLEKDARKSCPIEERECTYPLAQFKNEMTSLNKSHLAERAKVISNQGGMFGGAVNQEVYALDKKFKDSRIALEKKRNSLAYDCSSKYPALTQSSLY